VGKCSECNEVTLLSGLCARCSRLKKQDKKREEEADAEVEIDEWSSCDGMGDMESNGFE